MTPRQMQALKFIDAYQRKRAGISPTFSEIAAYLGLASKANVARIVDRLEEVGYVTRDSERARSLRITGKALAYIKRYAYAPGSLAQRIACQPWCSTNAKTVERFLKAIEVAV